MPRKYVKTVGPTSLFKYTPEVLSAAVTSVESGENSIREAAHQFRVPYGTIFNRIKGLFTGKHGGPTVLNDCEERELCDVVQIAGQWGFPLTQSDIRFLVKSYLDTNQRVTRFKKNLPGYDWISSFLARNKSKLSIRLSQNIKRNRAKVNPTIINEYFDKLAATIRDVPPENIVNYDETNFTDDPESKTVIVRKGQKHVENVLDHSKSSFSVMFAGAADGTLLPPYIVYAALHLYPTWTEGGPRGSRYNRTKSGWFDTMIFEDWFLTLALPYFKSLKNDHPKVIIGDNVASHVSYKVIRSCLDNNIRFVFLPPNATHLCQPLDVAFFRPLKKSWKLTLENWKKRSRGSVPKHLFPRLLKTAIDEIQKSNAQNLKSGFKATGIYPLNRKEVLKRLPTEVDTNSTPSSNGPNCSFSEQLVNLMKQERYGESPSRNIPKRRRLMDIQPGESVSEQQAQEILAKKEVSLYDGYINPDESGHKKIRIKQEKDDDSNPMSSAKPKKGKQTKRAQKSQVRVKIPFRDENLNPDDNVPKKIKVKQEKDDSLILGTERKKFKRNQKKGKKGESLKSSVSNILISSEEQHKLNKQQEKLPARSCLKKRLTRIRN